MELGERLRQARLEKGLSQRQLCGDEITRNMLSQIENGSAKPSMDTLRYLAGQLGKSVGYFLEEETASPNQSVMEAARTAWKDRDCQQVLSVLQDYTPADSAYDDEKGLLEILALLKQAEDALAEGRIALAEAGLVKVTERKETTLYYTQGLEKRRLELLFQINPEQAKSLVRGLPDFTDELLLRAGAALSEGNILSAGRILDAALPTDNPAWHLLRGKVYMQAEAYSSAIAHFQKAQQGKEVLALLERCHRELEDYKMAYHYACKLREAE